MNWKIFQWWAGLTPTNKLISGLGIALIALSTSLATLFGILNANKDATIEAQRLKNENLEKTIARKDEEIARCREEANKRAYDDVQYEREQARRADSMYYALTAAQAAVQKAIKNGKK